jgi:membrane-bound serine protease (ClpP class)
MADMARLFIGASRFLLLLVAACLLAAVGAGRAGARDAEPAPLARADTSSTPAGPVIDLLRVGGPIDATVVRYLDSALDKAAAEGVEVVVLELDSTGLLDVSLDEALAPLADREVPLAVWVGPPGARATGGAAHLAAAADVVAVAPGTVLGAAEPLALDGDAADPQLALAAQARTRLEQAGLVDGALVASTRPDVELPADAALPGSLSAEDVRIVDDAAVGRSGFVDYLAFGQDDLLRELDGRSVTLGGAERVLDVDPVTANVRFNNQGLWGRILHAVANPTLAYLLVVAGLMAIAFEFFQPGFGVAGLSGLLTTALGLYGFAVLPTRPLMAVLVVAGIALLSIDLAVGGFGLVTLAGTVSLAVGSARLYGGTGALGVPAWVVVVVVAFAAVFFVGIMTTVLRAQGAQTRAGAARVEGKLAVVRSMLNPEGHVFVEGALWRARAPEEAGRVKTGTTVRVLGTSDGRTLDVEVVPADDDVRASHIA